MKLAWRLTFALNLGAAAFWSAHEWERERRERAAFVADVERDHRDLGVAITATWNGRVEDLRTAADRIARSREGLAIAVLPPGAARKTPDGSGHVSYIPIQHGGADVALLEITEKVDWHRTVIGTLRREAVIALCAMLIFFFALTAVLSERLVGRPTRALVDRTRRIGEGDLAPANDKPSPDELGELSRAIDDMRHKLAETGHALARTSLAHSSAITQLRHADRLSTVGKLAAGIAHELGTPLNVITGRASFLARATEPADVQRQAGAITEAAERMSRLVKQLLSFARRNEPKLRAQTVWPVVQRATAFVEPLARKRGVTIEGHCEAADVEAEIDGAQIEQVLTNLLMNAIQASAPTSRIEVRATADATSISIAVQDRGEGISEAEIAKVFDPFYTTKDVGEGTGLGLSVARGIAEDHGGTIALVSKRGAGTTATLKLPKRPIDGSRPAP